VSDWLVEAIVAAKHSDGMGWMRPYLHPEDVAADYVVNGINYEWARAIAEVVRPGRILEIGVYRGYDACAFVLGHPAIEELWLVDAEYYGPKLADAADRIAAVWKRAAEGRCERGKLRWSVLDTQRLSEGFWPARYFDLIVVDGDHTVAGAIHDLRLVWPCLTKGGVLLFDDVDHIPDCKIAADAACREWGIVPKYLPTFRGQYLLVKEGGAQHDCDD
jgi:predicted O-methyltransferase YrrM